MYYKESREGRSMEKEGLLACWREQAGQVRTRAMGFHRERVPFLTHIPMSYNVLKVCPHKRFSSLF